MTETLGKRYRCLIPYGQAIRGKGAFGRFMNTIRYYGIEQLWYDYLENAYREIAIRWCREHDLKYIEK